MYGNIIPTQDEAIYTEEFQPHGNMICRQYTDCFASCEVRDHSPCVITQGIKPQHAHL